jgi:hypothetical protein
MEGTESFPPVSVAGDVDLVETGEVAAHVKEEAESFSPETVPHQVDSEVGAAEKKFAVGDVAMQVVGKTLD